jgi:hypothetical protein
MNDFPRKFLYALVCVAMISSLGATRTSASSQFEPEARTIRVSTTGTDAVDCGTEAKPCRSIQYAVNMSSTGDTILVAAGTYTYNGIDPCLAQVTRSVVCWWDKQLTINGGYSESNWTVADPVNNLTTIDGGSQYRGVLVWRVSGTASLTMQGFTIQNSRAQGNPSGAVYSGHAFGAGMWASKAFVNLKNMVFKNNLALGGSSQSYASAGWAFGGGLAIEGPTSGGNSTLEKITFTGNQARGGSGSDGGGNAEGGGIFVGEAVVTAKEITLSNNIAKGGDTGGNACAAPGSGYGGAMVLTKQTNLNLSYITATGNQALGSNAGGANSCGGQGIGGAFWIEEATVSISDSLLQANLATGGIAKAGGIGWEGGVYTEKANLTLDRVKFIANVAASGGSSGGGKAGDAGGGGAYFGAWTGANYYTTIMNCLFAENKAVMATQGAPNYGGGGGLYILGIAATITHSTFVNNQLLNGISVGQGVMVNAAPTPSGSKPGSAAIKYSIFTDHRNNYSYNNSAVQIFAGSSGSLSYIWFGNNKSDMNVPAGTPTDHIWTDSNSAGYISPSAPEYDYHLQSNSPVIDLAASSSSNIDLDRQARPVGPKPDLGAYEYSVPTLKPEKPVLYVMTDTSAILSLTDLISVSTGPIAEWNATTSSSWVYLGPSGTSQQTTGQTGTSLTIRFDPSKIPFGSYVVTINLTSLTANPTSITIYFYYVDRVEKAYLPDITK